MCVTCCSPSERTSPRVIVVLPAAESPTTPRMIGRGTSSASRRVGGGGSGSHVSRMIAEDRALEDVVRLDRDQLVAREAAVELEQAAPPAPPGPAPPVAGELPA